MPMDVPKSSDCLLNAIDRKARRRGFSRKTIAFGFMIMVSLSSIAPGMAYAETATDDYEQAPVTQEYQSDGYFSEIDLMLIQTGLNQYDHGYITRVSGAFYFEADDGTTGEIADANACSFINRMMEEDNIYTIVVAHFQATSDCTHPRHVNI